MTKHLIICLLFASSCTAQKDSLKLVPPSNNLERVVKGDEKTEDENVDLLSPLDMQRRLLKLEELAVKNGWEVVSKYGVLNTKDVEQFRTLDDKALIGLYSTGLLRRFAESLKVSVIGTKAVLVKNIKLKVTGIR